MSSALRKVRSGDPLVIPAAAYNAFIDAALDFRQRTAHLGQGAQPSFPQSNIVLVRNDSGSDQNRMAVLGVDAPIIDPSANEEEFKNRVALACVTPEEGTHEGRFVVLAEPIADGKIGRAYATGVCPVKIDVPDEEHEWRYAEIADGIAGNLKVSMQGSATILWRAGGTGVQWAVIRLGQPAGGDSGRWFRIVSSTRDGTNYRWTYTARRITKATPGYGGWVDDLTDTLYTLYNGIDDANGSTGTFGNGVSSRNLSGSFEPVPLGAGAKVHAMPVKVASTGEIEWWIDRVGQIDGKCI